MRRFLTPLLAFAVAATALPAFAAQQTGNINGTAHSASGQALPNYTVRLRSLDSGNVVGQTTSSSAGNFSFTGLPAGNYEIEIVNQAGTLVATSTQITLATGATASITVTASAAAAIGTAAAAGGIGGAANTALLITAIAAGGGIVAVVAAANSSTASPSR